MALLTETNAQYYTGSQDFISIGQASIVSTLDTPLNDAVTSIANYVVSVNTLGAPTVFTDLLIGSYNVATDGKTVAIPPQVAGVTIRIQLNQEAIWNNYGSYSYVSLNDIINNFMIAYVGTGKLIPNVKRNDVVFHAKRGLQEFSYDTLKSIKSQELTIPPSLSIIIPQDYVNYVRCSWIDDYGVKHIIYPTTLTSNPYTTPIQDGDGVPTQDNFGENLEAGQSITNERWDTANDRLISGNLTWNDLNNADVYGWRWDKLAYGQRYGLNPETSQKNGWFTIDEREGKFSFSSNLANRLIIFEYISDGLSSDLDTKVPKLAEEAMYMHLVYSILAGRSNIQEYVVSRYKRERRAALRNAKIRLQNIKLDELVQVMRNKSKWIKH